jgi:hypothetical protein
MMWQPIETAPPDTDLIVAWWSEWSSKWLIEVNVARRSNTMPKDSGRSNGSAHGSATHWMPLPPPPAMAPTGDDPK